MQTFCMNNLRILRIQNTNFSGYCFHMDKNKWWGFQICISVPLNNTAKNPKYNWYQRGLAFMAYNYFDINVYGGGIKN